MNILGIINLIIIIIVIISIIILFIKNKESHNKINNEIYLIKNKKISIKEIYDYLTNIELDDLLKLSEYKQNYKLYFNITKLKNLIELDNNHSLDVDNKEYAEKYGELVNKYNYVITQKINEATNILNELKNADNKDEEKINKVQKHIEYYNKLLQL